MGCSTSKQTLCRNCQAPISRTRRMDPSVHKARNLRRGGIRNGDDRGEHDQPKIPTQTPPGIINVWELMKDIDGDDGGPPVDSESKSNDTSIIFDFDPEIIASFRKALEELPPTSPFHLKTVTSVEKQLPGKKVTEKLIVYFTSLRGVRSTYEDCCHVRVILNSLGVRVDERDVSMHSRFKEELRELSGGIELPMVFIGREFIGGAEEIRRMDEEGKLKKLVEVCDDGDGGKCVVCDACGDIRFVVCEMCSGSSKIHYEGGFEEEDIDEKEVANGFHKCPDCNENGIIRCPVCCD